MQSDLLLQFKHLKKMPSDFFEVPVPWLKMNKRID